MSILIKLLALHEQDNNQGGKLHTQLLYFDPTSQQSAQLVHTVRKPVMNQPSITHTPPHILVYNFTIYTDLKLLGKGYWL